MRDHVELILSFTGGSDSRDVPVRMSKHGFCSVVDLFADSETRKGLPESIYEADPVYKESKTLTKVADCLNNIEMLLKNNKPEV